ncbi:glycosyltransferase family 33 protein [Amanita thiersii Skay4041]|uniref:Chitobiosyldiphosphodolichol beta-mannosyltransferase n=1 Tax=Amanita thiersii Skay4041 TaxID=703135 RepID=A0A2A9P1P7_9AGAR|nr:glycosyltransferase family 33 protein [Amanita thiersii Skay4041]
MLWASEKRPVDGSPNKRSVAILVLGDIGRSPRMMYHANSFAINRFDTHIIGYRGSRPIPSLEKNENVHFHYLSELPAFFQSLPFPLSAPLKIAHQICSILAVFFLCLPKRPGFILVQNPPSIPTLALAQLITLLQGSKLIIDWHNLGYSILALKLGSRHPFVTIARWLEATLGQYAYAHLFVTQAMCDFLVQKWSLQGRKFVLHDRPPQHFHRSSIQETHLLFQKLSCDLYNQELLQEFLPQLSSPHSTPFTYTSHETSVQDQTVSVMVEKVALRHDRPALLVSSTSWTPDEDFDILLNALSIYEAQATRYFNNRTADVTGMQLPKLFVIVTGKGPLKDKYIDKVNQLQKKWNWVRCISLWLEAEDYPTLLGSADLGVCLHASSSALDLPMKIVDMFGCGLPVCALDFSCLGELVKNGINGLIFKDASQLAKQLEELFLAFPEAAHLESLRTNLSKSKMHAAEPAHSADWKWNNWDDNWNHVMKPLVVTS